MDIPCLYKLALIRLRFAATSNPFNASTSFDFNRMDAHINRNVITIDNYLLNIFAPSTNTIYGSVNRETLEYRLGISFLQCGHLKLAPDEK